MYPETQKRVRGMAHMKGAIAILAAFLMLAGALGSGVGGPSYLAPAAGTAPGPAPSTGPGPAAVPARAPPGPAGWYIDDVVVTADTIHNVLNETFETGGPGWTHGGENDSWEIGSPANPAGPGVANGGSGCAATNLSGPYMQMADCWLRSPDFDLGMAFSASLSYYDWFDIAGEDSLYLSVEALAAGEFIGSDPIRINGSHTSWAKRTLDFTQLTYKGGSFPSIGSGKVHIIYRLVSGACPRLAAEAGNNYVKLNWTPTVQPDRPVLGYSVHRGGSPGSLDLYGQPGNVTEFNDTSVTNWQTYYYSVAAYDAIGVGTMSNTVNATPGALPGQPENLTAYKSNSKITLCWSPPLDAEGSGIGEYHVFRAVGTEADPAMIGRVGAIAIFEDAKLAYDTVYFYSVSAVNRLGEGPKCPAVPFAWGGPPSTPQMLNASGQNHTIRLTWRPPADAAIHPVTEYIVHRWNGSGREQTSPGGNRTEWEEWLGHPEKVVFYSVTARNDYGASSATPTVSLRCPSAPGLPTVTPGALGTALNWKAPDSDGGCSIDHYNVYRSVNGSVPELVWFTTDDRTECLYPVSENSTASAYSVTAVNTVGESDPSPQGAPPAENRLPEVAITSPVTGSLFNRTLVEFSGTASDPAVVDRVEISVEGHAMSLCDGIANWRATILLAEGTSRIIARATDIVGNSALASVFVRVDLSPPAVWFVSPPDRSVQSTYEVNVAGRSSDVSSVIRVELGSDGTSWHPASGTGNWTGELWLVPGPNALFARAWDAAGNAGTARIDATLDTENPILEISAPPASGRFRSGQPILVEGVASDDTGVRQVEVRLDAGGWLAANGTARWGVNIAPGPGNHLVQARATDAAGRQTVAGVNITVGRAGSPAENLNGIALAAATVLAAAAIAIAAVILRARGKRGASGIRFPRKRPNR